MCNPKFYIPKNIAIFGTDYDTEDGTCVRDFVHVEDLATAHILALEHLLGGGSSDTFNLGSGSGYSVRQVIEEVARETGGTFSVVEARRRPGDPPVLVADTTKAQKVLNWQPQLSDLKSIVQTARAWRSKNG